MQSSKRETVTGLNIIFGLVLLGWPFMALFAVNLAEADRARFDAYMLTLIVAVWAYPVTYLIAQAWSRHALEHRATRRHAVRVALIPAVNLAVALLATVLVWAHCGGEFVC